jgi:hypothetical protein
MCFWLAYAAVVAKPTQQSGWRRTWNLGHWWIGRTAIALGIANVYLGLIDEAAEETRYVVAYSVVRPTPFCLPPLIPAWWFAQYCPPGSHSGNVKR